MGGPERGAEIVSDLGEQTRNEHSWGKQKIGKIQITSEQKVPELQQCY